YLNANNYQNIAKNYFVEVLSEGPYFLISDDYFDYEEILTKSIIGGAVGGISGSLSANRLIKFGKDIICFDIFSGQFIPVNKNNMRSLIESNGEILKLFEETISNSKNPKAETYYLILDRFNKEYFKIKK
ncbi:MAG: hypothetical protein ACRCVT_11995, partial [Leadbetterella sp.]